MFKVYFLETSVYLRSSILHTHSDFIDKRFGTADMRQWSVVVSRTFLPVLFHQNFGTRLIGTNEYRCASLTHIEPRAHDYV